MRRRVLVLALFLSTSSCSDSTLTAPDEVPSQFNHTPAPATVTIAASLQSEVGCPGDWNPACAASGLTYDASDDVWQQTFAVPAGSWEYKVALNGSWDENYGAGAVFNGPNIPLSLAEGASVKFYYSHDTHWTTTSASVIATAAGSFQSELGCPGDWQPDCLRSWLQDPDGDGTYTFETTVLPPGAYETKVAIAESWDENYGAGGALNGSNIPFTVSAAGTLVSFSYNATTHVLAIEAADPPSTVEVNSLVDPGNGVCDADECTLREALAAVAAGGEVTFEGGLSGTIALAPAAGQLVIDRPVTVSGPGADVLTVRGNRDAQQPGRVLLANAAGGDVVIRDLSFTKGWVNDSGGCIQGEGTRLFLERVVVADCEGYGAGGGVGSTGTNAHGGYLSLVDATVRNNWAANGGGGIFNNHSSELHVSGSTVSGNEGREGGGIGSTGPATIVNTTVSGNRSRARGGGIDQQNGTMTIAHATIVDNESDMDHIGGDGSGGGVFFYGDYGALVLEHTIVADNVNGSGDGPDCAASPGRLPITSAGYNLIGDDDGCAYTSGTGDVIDADPLLGPLADNGGPTSTHLPLRDSPAHNAGDPAFAPPPADDQRGLGFPRVQNGRIDIGAVEEAYYFPFSGFVAPIANWPAFNSAQAGQTVSVKFSLGGDEGLSIFAAGYPTSTPVACPAAAQASSVEAAVAGSASSLTYDPETETYNYLWRTQRSWAGTCRQLTVKLTDGSEHIAQFRFR